MSEVIRQPEELISVLVVDDDPSQLKLGRLFLERGGKISVDCALSGQVALRKIREKEYDAIVCDYQMPEMDGIGVLKSIKSLGIETPIIIFTGKGREEVVIDALNYGAYSYLQKGEDPNVQFGQLTDLIFRAVQRKKAEKDLIENLQKYRKIVEDQKDLLYRFTPDGTFTFVNQPYSRHAMKIPEDMIGKSIFECIHEKDRMKLEDIIGALADGFHAATIDLRTPATDGDVRWQRSTIHAIHDREGRTIEFQAEGKDITDAKRAEKVLLESEERLRAVFNPSTDFIRVLNRLRQERREE